MMKINEKQTTRVTRASINGGKRNVLTISGKDPNYKYRVVNDVGDRVTSLRERGYEIVSDPSVKLGDRRVANPAQEGSPVMASVGGGTKGYVMRIKKEWFDEDQKAKAKEISYTEASMVAQAKEGMYGKLELNTR